jgi:chaperonin cofactor prefoldin
MHEDTLTGYADYRMGERVAKTEARLDAAEDTNKRLETKLDKLQWWIISTLAAAVGSLLMSALNIAKHG